MGGAVNRHLGWDPFILKGLGGTSLLGGAVNNSQPPGMGPLHLKGFRGRHLGWDPFILKGLRGKSTIGWSC